MREFRFGARNRIKHRAGTHRLGHTRARSAKAQVLREIDARGPIRHTRAKRGAWRGKPKRGQRRTKKGQGTGEVKTFAPRRELQQPPPELARA
eukprot:2870490-Alexandrium_andersonii.AAC.2